MTLLECAVLGGGQAGLAAAALLRRAGIDAVVLERTRIAATWRGHYDRLRLNTDRRLSGLPGLAIDARAGQWPTRDAFVGYLEDYAAHHGLDVRSGVEVTRLDRTDDGWRLGGTDLRARRVVVATGVNSVPVLPPWAERLDLPLLHSGAYRNAAAYAGQHVLVVGGGNSGAEIAVDLSTGGAVRTTLSVKDAPALLPRALGPVPVQLTAFALNGVPSRVADLALGSALAVLRRGDGRRGLPVPRHLVRDARAGATPVVDAGLREAVHQGVVRVVPAVQHAQGRELVLLDGTVVRPDAVVAATGWRTGLEPLVGHLGVLDERGRPRVHGGRTVPGQPRLHFVGYGSPLTGFMHAAGHDAAALVGAVRGEGPFTERLHRVRRLLPLPA